MNEYPLITRKEVKSNNALKTIQKETYKKHRKLKVRFPKAKISKLVKLRESNSYYDLTDKVYDKKELQNYNKDVLLETTRSMGICGLGGSGFPLERKLESIIHSKAPDKYLIINGVECDPGLLQDAWLLQNRLPEIEAGIKLLTKVIPFSKVLLATKEATSNTDSGYDISVVPDRYPMGAEKILIEHLLGIKLAPKDVPAEKGVLVINAQTVHAIYEALYFNRPADSRFITVADLTSGESIVARVNLSAPVIETANKLIKAGLAQAIYYGGGILSGIKATPIDKLTVKTNFIGYGKEVIYDQSSKCKKCGACSRNCPMEIKVNKLIQAIEKNASDLKEFHTELCIRCGTCTYLCAAGKNTMELVTSAKEV